MMWKIAKLGDISKNIQTGPFGSQLHQSDYSECGIPVVMPKDLVGGKISEESIARVDKTHVERLCRHKIEVGDILYSRRGDVGRCAHVTKKEEGWLCGTGCLRVTIDSEKADSRFVFFQLQHPDTVGWVEKHAVGATMLNLNTTILSSVPIRLPALEIQKRIADILSAYDDLIENNQKQIKLLEEAAQRLYKEWFVDLRFPGHENTKIVDGVPEGWRKFPLEEIAPVVTGKKDANYGDKGGNYPFFTCSQETITAPGYSFDTSAVILAGNGDFNVKLYRGKFEAYQRTYVLAPFDHSNLFNLYFTVQNNMEALAKGASGSTIKFLTKGMLQKILVLTADKKILDKFNDYEENIQQKVEALKKQVEDLTEIRNRLLPKLMSGEVEV